MEPNETTQLLKAIPLTNVEIATALGVSKEIVSRWPSGTHESGMKTLLGRFPPSHRADPLSK